MTKIHLHPSVLPLFDVTSMSIAEQTSFKAGGEGEPLDAAHGGMPRRRRRKKKKKKKKKKRK